jgi:hypothetical protein
MRNACHAMAEDPLNPDNLTWIADIQQRLRKAGELLPFPPRESVR